MFAKNHWYAAAWASEIGDTPFARRLLGEPVVLFRQADGRIAALLDRCPHRLVPLSMGVCLGGAIRCGYHGLMFNGAGACIKVPGQALIPPKARVRSFPVAERYGLVWIWPGDPGLADEAALPTLAKHGAPGWDLIEGGYQHHPSNYLNIVENLMDPSHTTFLHRQTIGNPLAAEAPVRMERDETHVVAFKWLDNTEPSQFDRQVRAFSGAAVDRGQFFHFFLPSISWVDIVTLPAGEARTDTARDRGLRTNSYKFLTPETERSTHFFWLHLRNYAVGDAAWSAKIRANLEQTYLEDREVEMAMQRAQDELGVRQLVNLEIDRAPLIALRMIERLVQAEQGGSATSG